MVWSTTQPGCQQGPLARARHGIPQFNVGAEGTFPNDTVGVLVTGSYQRHTFVGGGTVAIFLAVPAIGEGYWPGDAEGASTRAAEDARGTAHP